MKFIADENIPLIVVHKLREAGYDIISISESYRGIADEKVIKIAQKEKCYIITFDKDFGELVFRLKLKAEGIILLRILPQSIEYIYEKICIVLKMLSDNEGSNFIVVDDNKLRIRKLKR